MEEILIHEGRDGLPLKVAVVEITVAPLVIAGHGDIGLKRVRGKVELVPGVKVHV